MECAVPVYRLTASKGLTFIKKLKWWIYNIFSFLCIFDGFLNLLGIFLWKAYQTLSSCQNFPTGQPSSINNKNRKILTKRPPVATTVPSGTQRHHWSIGIPGYTFGSLIQAREISPSKGLTFIKKWKWWIYNILAFLCKFDGFLNFWVFFVETNTPKIVTKRPPVASTVPWGTQRHHWSIGIAGVPSDLRSRPEQSTTFLGSSPPVTTGSLLSLQWASPPSTLQKRRFHSLFMIVF